MINQKSKYRKLAFMVVLAALSALATLSLLPLIETNIWWIRFMDFPRLQLAVALSVLLTLYAALRGSPTTVEMLVVVGAVGALTYQVYKLHPYSKLVKQSLIVHAECEKEDSLRIMVANVERKKDAADAFLNQVAVVAPDLLLIMETDAWWDSRLEAIQVEFPSRIQSLPDTNGFYGMHFLSKLELLESKIEFFFGADTPTAVARIKLPSGNMISFIGLHPKPPLAWSQPTTMRDAHLLQAAFMARASGDPTIVAGDFNAVPWERVTRRAMRIGGLRDPRFGRGLFATYDANRFLISWPLDHILFQQHLRLQSFERLPYFGSDHLAVVVTLCHEQAAVEELPVLHNDDLLKAERSIEAAKDLQSATSE